MDPPAQDIFIGRQPILDRGQRLYAYELLFRSGQQNRAEITDDTQATATVLSHAITELGLEAALGPSLGFINLDARMLMSDVLEMLPREKFVLEVLETVTLTDAVVKRCGELKGKGFTLALDDFVFFEERFVPLLDLADIVKIDLLGMSPADLEGTVRSLRRWPVRLLAEKVETEAEFERCLALGFDFFQGYFFAKPTLITGRKLSHSEITLSRLLGLILEDADVGELEAIFKPEPGLTLNLLRLTNSAASGVRQKITSVRHAITVLGRRQLQRWLQLLVYAGSGPEGDFNSPLLQLAATRGRFMELLAGELQGSQRDLEERAFMTGLMSLMPTLLHVPIEEIVASLNVASDVHEALVAQTGLLGTLLGLAQAHETGDWDQCFSFSVELPGLDLERINGVFTRALAWAASLGQEAGN